MPRNKEFDKKIVLNKALNAFWKYGYSSTSMQILVDEMGISRRSIYDTFGNKDQIFLDVIDIYNHKFIRNINDKLSGENNLHDKLNKLFIYVVSMATFKKRGCLIVNSISELTIFNNQISDKINLSLIESEKLIYQLFIDAKRNGEINMKNNDILNISKYLNNSLIGLRVMAKSGESIDNLSSIVRLTLANI